MLVSPIHTSFPFWFLLLLVLFLLFVFETGLLCIVLAALELVL